MYQQHFSLKEEPFSITSDPKFLWLSHQHEEAFAHLHFAVTQRKGFAALTGDIGTGKTTLINSLLDRLGNGVRTAVVYNASLNTDELFQYIFRDFGISGKPANRSEAVIRLNDWLLEQADKDVNAVIVVDEAQNLSIETLEDLRLLSNLETSRRKLLQIVLVGQPQLNDKLAAPELEQLQQRIAMRYHLKAFNESDTRQYVAHRFQLAGGNASTVFAQDYFPILYQASGGVPRVINQICDTALLRAYSNGLNKLGGKFLQEVLNEDFPFRTKGGKGKRPRAEAGTANAGQETAPKRKVMTAAFLFLLLIVIPAAWWTGKSSSTPAVEQPVIAAVDSSSIAKQAAMLKELELQQSAMDSLQFALEAKIRETEAIQLASQAPTPRQNQPALVQNPSELAKVRIRKDDTLMKIVEDHYGSADWRWIELVLKENSHIDNPNRIRVGDVLVLPANQE